MLAALGQLARRRAALAAQLSPADVAGAFGQFRTRTSLGSASSVVSSTCSPSSQAVAAASAARLLSRAQQLQAARWVATAGGAGQQDAALSKARRMAGPVGLLAGEGMRGGVALAGARPRTSHGAVPALNALSLACAVSPSCP